MKKIITDSAANLNVTALNGIEHQSVGLTLIGYLSTGMVD